MKNKHVRY